MGIGSLCVGAIAQAATPTVRSGVAYEANPSAYISDPGVVSLSPVSSTVFSPERIIGQPP